jgi:hypothetical protein
MGIRRAKHDMFGRSAAPAPAGLAEPRTPLRQRRVPPGLRPFVPVITLIVILACSVVLPVLGITLLVVVSVTVLSVIVRTRYLQVKGRSDEELRAIDPIWRLGDAWRELNRYHDQRGPRP